MTGWPVVLVGAPGAGKSTVGRRLAHALGVPFRDTDADVEAMAGTSVSDIFISEGEPAFRAYERAAVERALGEHRGVLSLGGGAVCDPQTRALLREHTVVWLQVGLAAAASRVGLSGARPLLLGDVRATMKRLLDERNALYAEVATFEIPTDGLGVDAVVTEVRRLLSDHAEVRT